MANANSQRTLEELNNMEFNYFIAFKISLNEKNPTKIEETIKKVTSDPKGGIMSRRLLELKADAIEIMCNDAVYNASSNSYLPNQGGRAKEASKAKTFKLNDTVKVIEILCQTRKTLLKSEINQIYTSANKTIKYFEEKELMDAINYLTKQGVKIVDNVDNKIPFFDFQQIEKQLQTLNKDDLYELLNIPDTTPIKDIDVAIETLYKSVSKLTDLKKKQAISNLCGTSKKILLNAESKLNYDQYLKVSKDIWKEFDKRKEFGMKELSIDEYLKYVQIAMNLLKINVNKAEEMIAIGCKYFQMTIIGKKERSNLVYCPYDDCGKLFVEGAKNCPHCGKTLEVLCWNCQRTMPLKKDDTGCPKCGATKKHHQLFLKMCSEIETAILKPNTKVEDLKLKLLSVKNILPGYEKNTQSIIFKKVKEYDESIGKKVTELEHLGQTYSNEYKKIEQLVNQKKYQTAKSYVSSLKAKFGNYNIDSTNALTNQIILEFNKAETLLKHCKNYVAQNNEKMAIEYAVKALEVSTDFTEATQILAKYPPKPVTNLNVKIVDNRIHLEWLDNFNTQFVKYNIIKKLNMPSKTYDDGTIVDKNLTIKFYDDENIVPGKAYYYAVYAERFGIKSTLVTSILPISIYCDVFDVHQELSENSIKVKWTKPQNVSSIEVWKNQGSTPPTDVGNGTKIKCDNDGFEEIGVKGEQAYLIVCYYEENGKKLKSKGIRVVYKPYETIKNITNQEIIYVGNNRYAFKCGKNEGTINLYYAPSKLNLPLNQKLRLLEMPKIIKGLTKIPTSINVDGDITFGLNKDQVLQIYPVVCTEQLFMISEPLLVNTMSPIDCTYTFTNGIVRLKGSPNQNTKKVIVKVSNNKFAHKMTDDGEKFEYSKEQLINDGKIDILLKTNTINYISVFCEFNTDGVVSYSEPFIFDAPIDYRESVKVYYSLDYKPTPTKKYHITISFRCDKQVELPPILLLKGSPKPMNKAAGELCEKIEKVILKKGLFASEYHAKCVLTVNPTSINMKFAIFFSDQSNNITLVEVRKI